MTATLFPAQTGTMGQPVARYESRAKVTGAAAYASDVKLGGVAHAHLHLSKIGRGTIEAFDLVVAKAVPGVIEIMTHETVADMIRQVPSLYQGGYLSDSVRPLGTAEVAYWGQPVAVVIAETFEAAREASNLIVVNYASRTAPSGGIGSEGATSQPLDPIAVTVGDADAAFEVSAAQVAAHYTTPTQHQNPMELFATQCEWRGKELVVYEPSQNVNNLKFGLADQLGVDPGNVRVISDFVGGAFGAKGFITPRTALVAIAAKLTGRPVKLVPGRDQGFALTGYRAETRHQIRISADQDGRLTSLRHEAWELTSRADTVAMGASSMTARLYACPNISLRVNAVASDRSTPGFMRAPGEMPYGFAMETALDELAVELGMDPVSLRRVNDTMSEPVGGLPYTSRSLMQCFDEASAAFGWDARTPEPGSMRDGDWLVGYGCATAFYPTYAGASAARVRLHSDGRVHVSSAGHELGQGMYTMMAQVAAEELGVPVDQVSVSLGDTDLPPAIVAGGSASTASVAPAIMAACAAIRRRLGVETGAVSQVMSAMEASGSGAIEEFAEFRPHGTPPDGIKRLYRGQAGPSGGVHLPDRVQFALGAQFVEVRIHAMTREIRVPRALGAFAAGRIINPRTAHGQLVGGMIWGISSALHEHTEVDERNGSYINANLADYILPVNADIGEIQAIMVEEVDKAVNPAGVKGVGEIGVVGVAAAIGNAVFHATGKRIRDLPIRLEHLA